MLDVYNSIRDAASIPPIIDGRHSLMLQERWEGSMQASIFDFFFAIWTVRSMHRRAVHFRSFLELRDFVLVSLQCPRLVRCCPTRSHKQRRQHRVCPPLPTPGVTIYRSDGACRGQGTIAETLASWSAAVWSADARGLGADLAFATSRGFLGNHYSNNQAEYFALLQCLFRALRLQDTHVIFEVDPLILAKQLARHLPWACRSENLIALHQRCVHVCDSHSALHISWDIRHIYREFNQTAGTLSNQAIDERDSNGFFSILVVSSLRIMFTCPLPQLHSFCQISELLLNVRSCARVCFVHLIPLVKKQKILHFLIFWIFKCFSFSSILFHSLSCSFMFFHVLSCCWVLKI